MTDKEILTLKKKINKARIEVSYVLEDLQNSVDLLEPEDIEKEKPIDDEPPF